MSGSIEVRGLSRTFHTTVRRPGFAGTLRSLVNPERVAKHAVSDITFDVAPGELLALLGPNGAGKSTTIKVLTGILTPTSGEARVAGVVPYQERERNARNIGAVFGQRTQLWWDLPVRESFAILRDIYEVPKAEHAARLKEFDDILDLSVLLGHPGPPPLPRPAGALRPGRRPAARPAGRLPRRADHRHGRGGEGAGAGVPAAPGGGARPYGPADHPRHDGGRAARRAGRPGQPRPARPGRHASTRSAASSARPGRCGRPSPTRTPRSAAAGHRAAAPRGPPGRVRPRTAPPRPPCTRR